MNATIDDALSIESPHIVRRRRGRYLKLSNGRAYRVPRDPVRALGLIDHLARTAWCSPGFLSRAIGRIAAARGRPIHPS